MLSVIVWLVEGAAMLISIVLPEANFQLDYLNGSTP